MPVNQILKRTSPNELYKERVKKIKHLLPYGIRQIVIKKYPEYDSMAGSSLFNNVLHGKSADIRLTEILEEIASEYQSKEKEA